MAADEVLSGWFARELGVEDAYVSTELGGGNSNVTLLVESSAGRFVIRRPPHNSISPLAARGVRREYDLLRALDGRARVPRALAFCDDPAVVGAPFAVVGYVPGVAITEALPESYPAGSATVNTLGEALIDAIAAVHTAPLDEIELPDWPRPEAFLHRQLERWLKIRADDAVRPLPLFERVAAELLERLPGQGPVTLVHGDFHLDNTLFSADRPQLQAIIDWELATLGDPRIDLGLMLAFWGPRRLERPAFSFVQAVTRSVPVCSREALAARWADATGFDAGDLDWFCAFSFWRLAAMVEGAFVLHRRGRADGEYVRNLEHDVPALLEEAALALGLAIH